MDNCDMISEQLMKVLGEQIVQNEQRTTILNPLRLQQIQTSSNILKNLAQESQFRIQVKLHEPFVSMGIICMECESIEFYNCKQLGRAIELADNVEIYSTTEGNVRFVLTFHGLAKQICS